MNRTSPRTAVVALQPSHVVFKKGTVIIVMEARKPEEAQRIALYIAQSLPDSKLVTITSRVVRGGLPVPDLFVLLKKRCDVNGSNHFYAFNAILTFNSSRFKIVSHCKHLNTFCLKSI
jgi:hypothetical protein